jgi:hypothetical protein
MMAGILLKALGEPKLPPKLVRALFLLLYRTCCFSCVVRPGRIPAARRAPEIGAKSKRITLDADVMITIDLSSAGAALGQFYYSQPGADKYSAIDSSPK